MNVSIRRAGPGDGAALALAAQASFLEAFAGQVEGADIIAHTRDRCGETYFNAWLSDASGALWLAEVPPGAAPVGYAGLAPPDLPIETGAGDIELRRIYLLQRFHGGGAGQSLMDAALEHAKQSSAKRMLIGVNDANPRAIAFYRRNGFSDIGTRRFQVGANHYDYLILARALA
jgi:GNAT superfamily N-acetyltransferase